MNQTETSTTQAESRVSWHRREAERFNCRATAGCVNTGPCPPVRWLSQRLASSHVSGSSTPWVPSGAGATGVRTANCMTPCGIVWCGPPSYTPPPLPSLPLALHFWVSRKVWISTPPPPPFVRLKALSLPSTV